MDNELRIRALELAAERGVNEDAGVIVGEATIFLAFLQGAPEPTLAAAAEPTPATAAGPGKTRRTRQTTADPTPAAAAPAASPAAAPAPTTSNASPVTAASASEQTVTIKMVADAITKLALAKNREAGAAILRPFKVERVSQLSADQLAPAFKAIQEALSPPGAPAAQSVDSLV